MTHSTAAATRQLELVELNSDGDPIGPVIRWPQDWPSAAEVVDLSAATLDQAVNAWRDWVTRADERLLVDVAPLGDDRSVRVVQISGRAWMATMTKFPAINLNAAALDYLDRMEIDPAAYISHWSGPGNSWTGDSCGCVDDRCIGYHHDASDECGCLEPWVADFMANVPVRDWNAARPDPSLASEGSAEAPALVMPTERAARPGELCGCGRPAITVIVTQKFGDVGYCGIPDGGAR